MTKKLSKLSIKGQLLIIIWSLITSLLFLYIYSLHKIVDYQYKQSIERIEFEVENYAQKISKKAEDLSKVITNIIYNPVTQHYLKEDNKVKKQALFLDMDKIIINLKDMTPGILDIIIVSHNDNNYNLSPQFKMNISSFIESLPKLTGNYYSNIDELRLNLKKIRTMKVGTPIYNLDHEAVKLVELGYIIILLDLKTFFNTKNLPEYINVFDRNNTPIILNSQDKNKTITCKRNIKEIAGTITGYQDKHLLYKSIFSLIKTNSLFFFLTISILLTLYSVVISNIVRTHERMINYINGDITDLSTSGYKEADLIGKTLGTMTETINQLSTRLAEQKINTQKAELNFLINQINPHFLYNTLESIKGIAASYNVTEISDITYALGSMFKYSLDSKAIVILEDEITLVKNYLEIQQLRFSNRFNYCIETNKEFNKYKIPKMILQPIVENSIIHGLENMESDGKLNIKIGKQNSSLIIEIQDNGEGIKLEKLKEILKRMESLNEKENRSIGLINVHKRLVLSYGIEYGLSIESQESFGTTVKISIPLQEKVNA